MLQLLELSETDENDKEGFFLSQKTKILNNLRVSIDKIHLRYQDTITKGQFGWGITMEKIFAQTTDKNGQPYFYKKGEPFLFKEISLQNFAIYWNLYSPPPKISSKDDLVDFFDCQVNRIIEFLLSFVLLLIKTLKRYIQPIIS